MSLRFDALRQHKAPPPPNPDAPAPRGAPDNSVPASLAYDPGPEQGTEGASSGKRLGLAVVLVLVTGMLLWQVASMNGLLPSGPFSRLFRSSAALRSPATNVTPSRPGVRPPASAAPAASASPDRVPPGPTALTGASGAGTSALPLSGAAALKASPPMPAVGGPKSPFPQPAVTARPAGNVPAPAPLIPPVVVGSAPAAPGGGAKAPSVSRGSAGETDHFKLALYYQRVGDFENALVHYRAVLAANELDAEAHNNLGVLYQSKSLYEEAIREFQRATFIDPRYDKAHNNLGVALLRSGKTDAAVSEFRWIVGQDPKNVEALTNLSLALKAAGRAEEAREMLQRALGINGRYAQAHYNLALIYEERGELQRAIDHFEQFLANAGSDSAALTVEVRTRVQALRAKLQ